MTCVALAAPSFTSPVTFTSASSSSALSANPASRRGSSARRV